MVQNRAHTTAGAHTGGGDKAARELPAMLTVDQVAALLGCSARHVYRLADMGRMPRPVKLGALVRWPRAVIESWIAAGCPSCSEGTD